MLDLKRSAVTGGNALSVSRYGKINNDSLSKDIAVPPPTAWTLDGQNTLSVNLIFAALGRVGCGQAVVSRGRVIEVCDTARTILERECSAATANPEQLYGAIRLLMNRAGTRLPLGAISWLATSFKEGFTIFLNQTLAVTPDEPRIVILVDLDAHPEPNPETLRNLFGFTAAETRLALELAQGSTLNEIAKSHQLSRTTIRSQLASLFIKTQTSRQSELIALLGRVTLLP